MPTPHAATRPIGYAAYKLDGCRCYGCALACSQYRAQVERMKAEGAWQPFVDAEPVRQHLGFLSRHGIGWRRACHLAGVSTGGGTKILYGIPSAGRPPCRKVRPETAAKLIAVRPGPWTAADHAVIDATGYKRRLQALVALGFPQPFLCARLGIGQRSNFHIEPAKTTVLARNHRAACALYDELWNQDPAACGANPVSVARARRYAARMGWPPPLAWDDDTIDDPAAKPDLGAPARRQDAIVEDAQFIARTTGADTNAIARRLGISRNYLEKARERTGAPSPGLADYLAAKTNRPKEIQP